MTLAFVSRLSVGSDQWNQLVDESPDGWVFSLYEWQELILSVEQWGLEDVSFAVMQNGQVIAVMPLQFNRVSSRLGSSAWGGSGPVVSKKQSEKKRKKIILAMLEHCEQTGLENKAVCFDFSQLPITETSILSCWGINPFYYYDADDVSLISQVIDLQQSHDKLWNGLSYDAKRQIRIAGDKGYSVKTVNWQEHIDRYYQLHVKTYNRTGVEPHPRSYFEGIANLISTRNNAVLWAAFDSDGEVVAYHNTACTDFGAYYHTGCSEEKVNDDGASYLLFWEAVQGMKLRGVSWYDCGAIFPNSYDAKQKGLTTFKSKFGGKPHRIFRVEKRLVVESEMRSAILGQHDVKKSLLEKLRHRVLQHMS